MSGYKINHYGYMNDIFPDDHYIEHPLEAECPVLEVDWQDDTHYTHNLDAIGQRHEE